MKFVFMIQVLVTLQILCYGSLWKFILISVVHDTNDSFFKNYQVIGLCVHFVCITVGLDAVYWSFY